MQELVVVFPGHSLAAVVPVQTQSHKADILRASPPPSAPLTATPRTSSPPSFPLHSHPFSPPVLAYFFSFLLSTSSSSSSHLLHLFTSLLTPVLFSPRCSVGPLLLLFLFIYCHHFFFLTFPFLLLFLTFHVLLTKCPLLPPRLLSFLSLPATLNPMKRKKDKTM